jgi:hypothetical protein
MVTKRIDRALVKPIGIHILPDKVRGNVLPYADRDLSLPNIPSDMLCLQLADFSEASGRISKTESG